MSKTYLNTVGSFECVVDPPDAGWIAESKEKQTPYVRIPIRVTEGPCKGHIAVVNLWLSNGAFDNTIKRMAEVFQFDGDLAALHLGKQTLAGKPCNIETEMETYEGKDRLKVKWLNPPGGGGAQPMDEAKVASILLSLNAKAKAIAKATNTAAKSGATAPRKSFEQVVDGDPSPFDVPS